MEKIKMTAEEQLKVFNVLAFMNFYEAFLKSDFISHEDTQKSLRISSNIRVLNEVVNMMEDGVVLPHHIREHLAAVTDPLVTRWKMFLPEAKIEELKELDAQFAEYAREQLIESGLDEEEAGKAVGKIIPFPVKDGE